MELQPAFPFYVPEEVPPDDHYRNVLTVVENRKGVLDVDTTKGCTLGMAAYPNGEFTRLAHAKKTLNMRKFPKREQKIIVAYKGDISTIKDLYAPVGRL